MTMPHPMTMVQFRFRDAMIFSDYRAGLCNRDATFAVSDKVHYVNFSIPCGSMD
jgi:hypothetical protein